MLTLEFPRKKSYLGEFLNGFLFDPSKKNLRKDFFKFLFTMLRKQPANRQRKNVKKISIVCIEIKLPYNEHINIQVYNYLSPSGQKAIIEWLNSLFWGIYRQYVFNPKYKYHSIAIRFFMSFTGINDDCYEMLRRELSRMKHRYNLCNEKNLENTTIDEGKKILSVFTPILSHR